LEAQFTAALRRLKFDDEVLTWVKKALRQSHADERREHEAAIGRLQAEHNKIQRRPDTMYDDKLDGVIDEAFFRQSYIEDGARLLDLANMAAALFERQPAPEKRKLLRFVLAGCTWKNGQLRFEYRKPFDLTAEFEWGGKTRKAKKEHWNRNGGDGPEEPGSSQVTGSQRVTPIKIVAGNRVSVGQTAQNENWLLR
jgi:hypothetical protein